MKKLDVAGMDVKGENGRGLDVADSRKASVDYVEPADKGFSSEYKGPARSAKHAHELRSDNGKNLGMDIE